MQNYREGRGKRMELQGRSRVVSRMTWRVEGREWNYREGQVLRVELQRGSRV